MFSGSNPQHRELASPQELESPLPQEEMKHGGTKLIGLRRGLSEVESSLCRWEDLSSEPGAHIKLGLAQVCYPTIPQ